MKLARALIPLCAVTALAWGCDVDDAAQQDGAQTERTGSSFAAIRDAVYESPRDTLPDHGGLSMRDILRNILGNNITGNSSDSPTHGLAIRSRRTLVDRSDERPPEPKWLHPRGACASGRWTITTPSEATGLFADGVDVPAIVRVSSGTAQSLGGEEADGRILGMAVKLFPTVSDDTPVLTRNMVTLDRYGFEASPRMATFHEDDGSPVYFTNVAPAESFVGKQLSKFFDRFDEPNWARPVYAAARAQVDGEDLEEYVEPYEVRFVARPKDEHDPQIVPADFRDDLLSHSEGITLDIQLHRMTPDDERDVTIGQLTLDAFVVSDYCDLNLHFHHDPLEDQLSKYKDYEVVQDLIDARQGR